MPASGIIPDLSPAFPPPPTAEPPLPWHVGATAVLMVVGSYCDGFFGRRDWGMARPRRCPRA
jgi:hypothetical protein